MKRHILLAIVRFLLAVGVTYSLPYSHLTWGDEYPGDGQQAFGFLIIFAMIGFMAATVYFALGSLGQFLLRRRPARLTLFVDLALFLLFAGTLVYEGVTSKYEDSKSPPLQAELQPIPSLRDTSLVTGQLTVIANR